MQTRALLCTDLVDSTLLVQRLGDAAAAEVWAVHDRTARDLISAHHGREIDRADGFLLLFECSADAARFSISYQRTLGLLGIEARTAIHEGPVILRQNTADDVARGAKPLEVEGLAKPLCARLAGLARGGQTLLSNTARQSLIESAFCDAELQSHGHYRLKGIDDPVEVFELALTDRSRLEPPGDSDKAYRVTMEGDLWRPVRDIQHNLPAASDQFIGRHAELRALASQLTGGARLLTLLGPAGTGKTRLVCRYAQAWLGDWPGGIYFCDLSEARSLDGVLFAVAVAFQVQLGKGDPAVQLGRAIAARGHCLVILDNFEQVVRHAEETVGTWLPKTGAAAFVVTSRELLHLPSESVFAVEPLSLGHDAIELFAARARAQRPGFVLEEANRPSVAEIVRLLDGLPLAIELAAARMRLLSPTQLVERLRHRFQLLRGVRGAPARQATLEAAIDWSWNLLEEWERAAFAQCSVFEGGFRLEAAERVLDLSGWETAPPVMDAIQALVDKSLLRTLTRGEQSRYGIDEPYFGMYVSIQEYSRQRLALSGPREALLAEERHGTYFASFGADEAIESLSLHGGVQRRRELCFEIDNLVAACNRAAMNGQAEVALGTCRAAWGALELQGPFGAAEKLAAVVLSIPGIDARTRAIALSTRGAIAWRLGRLQLGEVHLRDALVLARDCGDQRLEMSVLATLGIVTMMQGRLDEARIHQEAALASQREFANRRAEGTVLGNLASIGFQQGRMDEARAQFESALVIHKEVGNDVVAGTVWSNLAGLHFAQGREDEARECCERAMAIHRAVGDLNSVGVVLGNLGLLHRTQGRLEAAREALEAALSLHRDSGDRMFEGGALTNLVSVYADQDRLEEARTHCIAALDIAREVGNPRYIATNLSSLADLLTRHGQIHSARAALEEGEELLRTSHDRPDLAKLLCQRGQTELAAGEVEAARVLLAETEAIALEISAGADSELGRLVLSLREGLARVAGSRSYA